MLDEMEEDFKKKSVGEEDVSSCQEKIRDRDDSKNS